MGRKEIKHDNSELVLLFDGIRNYAYLTDDGRNILKSVIDGEMKSSRRKYAIRDIFYLIRSMNEISLAAVRHYLDLRTVNKRTRPLSDESIKVYKRVCVAVSKAMLNAHQNSVQLLVPDDSQYLSTQQTAELRQMIKSKKPLDAMIEYLKGLKN
ncbi:hypothetical protein RSF09_000521 [Yersinia enterocolitica]|nr:hypothetical protein [Yersinia enterocolitica]